MLALAVEGLPSGRIGERLGISARTVEVHLGRIYRKTGRPPGMSSARKPSGRRSRRAKRGPPIAGPALLVMGIVFGCAAIAGLVLSAVPVALFLVLLVLLVIASLGG